MNFQSMGETLASRTAQALVDLSLAAKPGDYLGAENDLLQKFGISRPTLRQAAKMVADQCKARNQRRFLRGTPRRQRCHPVARTLFAFARSQSGSRHAGDPSGIR